MNRLRIKWLERDAATDSEVLTHVTRLINEAYAAAESGLWVVGATRTTEDEVAHLIDAGEIAVACRGRRIIGCMRVQLLEADTGEFGMLAADPSQRGVGVGRELVKFAEDEVRRKGADLMRLEVLVPRDWTHPAKEFLLGWYTRIGYVLERVGAIDETYPALAQLLAIPCDYRIYRKRLRDTHR